MTMNNLVKHIREILEQHHIDGQTNSAGVGCGCGAVDLADHSGHVAQQIIDRLELRKEAVGNKFRYVSAWFNDELTKLEGAE
jgi:hypothetical protein